VACVAIVIVCSVGKELKSAKGEVQEHHFKHHEITNCNASFESILHLTAKMILLRNKSFNTSQKGRLTLEAELEKVDGRCRLSNFLLYGLN
jgi:competence CoiA-like predicted nuclease